MNFFHKTAIFLVIMVGISACKTVSETTRITHIKPLSMKVHYHKNVGDKLIKFDQGYNPQVWDDGKGFAVDKMKKLNKFFPTTAFEGAEFDVIGSGDDQSNYRCQPEGMMRIKLSGDASKKVGEGCHITFIGRTRMHSSDNIIHLEEKIDNKWVRVDSYTIKSPPKWAILVDQKYKFIDDNPSTQKFARESEINNFAALDACRRELIRNERTNNPITTAQQAMLTQSFRSKIMFKADELTNSPYVKNLTVSNFSSKSFYARDIDGTFMGEWGDLSKYKKSGWSFEDSYLSADLNLTDGEMFGVNKNGGLTTIKFNEPSSIACRHDHNAPKL